MPLNLLKPLIQRAVLFAGRLTRGMTLGVRGLVIDGDGRVLLVRHSYLPGWYLPGGGVEPGETIGQAMLRELIEEAGVEAEALELAGFYVNRRLSKRDHVALFVIRSYRAFVPAPKIPNLEIVEIGFFAPDALPEGTTEATRRRIAEIVGGAAVGDVW